MNSLVTNKPRLFVIGSFFFLWLLCLLWMGDVINLVTGHGHFFLLGLMGAIAANSTGAGGGVVFVPSFNLLGLAPEQVIATSFAIQCFGMTMGSFSWLRGFANSQDHLALSQIKQVLIYATPASILGLWWVQYGQIPPFGSLLFKFSIFSIVLGVILLAQIFFLQSKISLVNSHKIDGIDKVIILVSCFIGGAITAWLSVGVGEILAVMMLLRGFSIAVSVAAAVCVSALTVWAGIAVHLIAEHVVFEILIFAAPAALIGGFIASYIARWIGARNLKLFLSFWILLVGVVHFIP